VKKTQTKVFFSINDNVATKFYIYAVSHCNWTIRFSKLCNCI